ncbi:YjgN family protein [Deinococcus sonorensis]|uniref:YjgN family protein n=2 Tax=Deinococcus sonorensis TaxID=309891 RepID=A0AAU7U8Y7_9DEIO
MAEASPSDVTPAEAAAPPVTTYPVQFTGEPGEYFRLWIVNVLLSVVTLGIYLPWARVRTRQYFYGHTWLDGQNFEYTANPVALLRGYLLVGVLFAAYSISQQFQDYWWITGLLGLLFFALYPFLLYRSLRFNAANTIHRGLSFQFVGRPGGAYVAYLLIMLSVPFSLGLTFPLAVWMQRRYLLTHVAYGTTRAEFNKDVGVVYTIFLTAVAVMIAASVVVGVLALVGVVAAGGLGRLDDWFPNGGPEDSVVLFIILGVIAYVLLLLLYASVGQYLRAALLRYSLQDLYLGRTLRLQTSLNPVRLAWINVSNVAVQLITLGLATPWAAIRRTRYLMAHLQVQTIASLDDFQAAATPQESALGEAASEFFNFDLGF